MFVIWLVINLYLLVKVKNTWSNASIPHVFVIWLVIKDGRRFTYALIGYICSNNRTTANYTIAYCSALFEHSLSRAQDYLQALLPHRKSRWAALFILRTVILHNKPHRYLAGNVKLIVCKVNSEEHRRTLPTHRQCMQFCLETLRTRTNVCMAIGVVSARIGTSDLRTWRSLNLMFIGPCIILIVE